MSRVIYAIQVEWVSTDKDGRAKDILGSNISQEAYENESDAIAFIRERTDYQFSNGWAGVTKEGDRKIGYFIKPVTVKEAK